MEIMSAPTQRIFSPEFSIFWMKILEQK